MAKNWGESAGDAFSQAFGIAQELAYKKWLAQQENDPEVIAARSKAQVKGMLAAYGYDLDSSDRSMGSFMNPYLQPWDDSVLNLTQSNFAGGSGSPWMMLPSGKGVATKINPIWNAELDIAKSRAIKRQDLDIDMEKKIREEAGKAGSSLGILRNLRQLYLKTNPTAAGFFGVNMEGTKDKTGFLPQPLYGVMQSAGKHLQLTRNQRADKEYVDAVNALVSRLAKGVIGEDVGNLTVWEQMAAKSGIGGLMDVKSVGIGKFDRAEKMIIEMQKARAEGYKSLDEKLISEGRILDGSKIDIAREYLKRAGGDANKARELAANDLWVF